MKKYYLFGFLGASSMLALFAVIVFLVNGFSHVFEQFLQNWYYLIPVSVTFGIQIGLYFFIKEKQCESNPTSMAASTGTSSVSMVACCAHHLTDVLPLLGLSGVLGFLTDYKLSFAILAIASNVIGITFILDDIKRRKIVSKTSNLSFVRTTDIPYVRNALFVIFSSILVLSLVFTSPISSGSLVSKSNSVALETKNSNENGISLDVTPFLSSDEVDFEISLNTHSGSPDYELTKNSLLEDENGIKYSGVWNGSPAGEHHQKGMLSFKSLHKISSVLKLTLKQIGGVDRYFEWKAN